MVRDSSPSFDTAEKANGDRGFAPIFGPSRNQCRLAGLLAGAGAGAPGVEAPSWPPASPASLAGAAHEAAARGTASHASEAARGAAATEAAATWAFTAATAEAAAGALACATGKTAGVEPPGRVPMPPMLPQRRGGEMAPAATAAATALLQDGSEVRGGATRCPADSGRTPTADGRLLVPGLAVKDNGLRTTVATTWAAAGAASAAAGTGSRAGPGQGGEMKPPMPGDSAPAPGGGTQEPAPATRGAAGVATEGMDERGGITLKAWPTAGGGPETRGERSGEELLSSNGAQTCRGVTAPVLAGAA